MKHLVVPAAALAAAGLALGSPAEAATPKKKDPQRGVVAAPVAYDAKTKRVTSVVYRWSTVGAETHRAHVVTTDLDVVTPARLAAVHARIKSRLQSSELEARVREGFQDDIKGLRALSGANSVRQITDQELVALLGTPGMRPSNASLASKDPLLEGYESFVDFVEGATGAAATAQGAGAPIPPHVTVAGGAFVAGSFVGEQADGLIGMLISAGTDGESDSLGEWIYNLLCGDSDDVNCGSSGDGTTLPPELDAGTAAGLINLHLATGLAGGELRQQLKGLEVAGGADVGITRERADLAAWLAIDEQLGGAYTRSIERGLDARGSQHGIRDGISPAGGIDPTQVFNYGRITPMPEMAVREVRPR